MSEELVGLLSQPVWVFLSVLARLSPALVITPPLQSASVPLRVRALLVIAIGAVLTPSAYANATAIPSNVLDIVICLAGEVLLGILIGSIIAMSILCLQIAGQAIGQLAGYDMATAVDPASNEDMPVISNLLGLLGVALLLIMGGHREMLDCCLESFAKYPVGAVRFEDSWLEELEAILRTTFVIGIRAGAPLATAMLVANVASGLLARTLPQLNVLAVGFNINAMALLTILSISIGTFAWVFQSELSLWVDSCHSVVAVVDGP